jgi:hypothetical protein
VHLTSGDVVIVSGSAISAIESTAASSDSPHTRKELGRKARKARPKTMIESLAIKPSKAAAKARTWRAEERPSGRLGKGKTGRRQSEKNNRQNSGG